MSVGMCARWQSSNSNSRKHYEALEAYDLPCSVPCSVVLSNLARLAPYSIAPVNWHCKVAGRQNHQ